MCLLLSGACLYDHNRHQYFQPSAEVTDIFYLNLLIQKSMGYNSQAIQDFKRYPSVLPPKVDEWDMLEILPELFKRVNGAYLRQVKSFKLNHKEVVSKNSYIMVRSNLEATLPLSSEVFSPIQHYIYIIPGYDNFSAPTRSMLQEILTCVNVQHYCYNGNCKVTKTSWPMISQQENKAPTKTIAHSPTNKYLLNACSHHSPILHILLSTINFAPVSPQQALPIIQQSAKQWYEEVHRKSESKRRPNLLPSE
ncbi:hypothetical protein VP01_335g13 [Puccinia sorghi]|uniref:Uncharacterized protein n=1 Tax=Puccinia sorghi TaxID=27349 RepID=A0A0L6UX21_9BASI|nr:hypothetical protein VP01_335g13 [Puccinia sorghi]